VPPSRSASRSLSACSTSSTSACSIDILTVDAEKLTL
jgi:hypothetical protein